MMECPYCKVKIFEAYLGGMIIKKELTEVIVRNKKIGTQIILHSCDPKKLLPKQKDLWT